MDAIDAALISISGARDRIRIRRLGFVSSPYPGAVRRRILRVAAGGAVPAGEISQLNFLLGELFAEAAIAVCRRARINPKRLSAIGSHGQTIYHQGFATRESARMIRATLQIAEPAIIAERTGAPVVADFRSADLAAGGQGAPLVPLVDYLLLRSRHEGVVALNLGGIANVTVIPARARRGDVFGFDTGPGNMLMDALVRRATNGRKSFDAGGRRAAEGKVLDKVLAGALADPYFSKRPPKSAGREQFGEAFLKRYFLQRNVAADDLLRTAAELTARSVADALRRWVMNKVKIHRLIVSGGGAKNSFLLERLAALLPDVSVCLSEEFGLPVGEKEAMAFAVLADRTMRGLPGNLPRVTGARRAVVLGKISRP